MHVFSRNTEWFEYIFANRAARPDRIADADVIIGPIANDTIYDTFGIITSGFLQPDEALKLLLIGPAYEQTVLKTEKAVSQLRWLSARVLQSGEVEEYRKTVALEETEYMKAFAAAFEEMQQPYGR